MFVCVCVCPSSCLCVCIWNCLTLTTVFCVLSPPGVISLSRSLHGKANTVIPMVVSAQDGGGLAALVNARVNISVVAGLVAPPVFEHSQYSFTVSENVLRGTEVGIVQAISKNGGCDLELELLIA